jgi:type I restriction enzyme S subunit
LKGALFPVVPFVKIIPPKMGIRYGTGTPPPIVEKGPNSVPFIRATDIKEGEIQEDDLLFIEQEQPPDMRKCLLSAGELIVVRSGVNTGDCAVVPEHLKGS